MATRQLIGLFLLMLGAMICYAEDESTDVLEIETETTGSGLVIELEAGGFSDEEINTETKSPAASVNTRQRSKNAGVEMIVGGQGQDGVAKKKIVFIKD